MSCRTLSIEESMPGRRDTSTDLSRLVEAASRGDQDATERLYAAARPRLLRAALALGVDPDAATDLVQETLWSAHRNLRRYDPQRASFDRWLGTILVRRAKNRWRALARGRRLLQSFAAVAPAAISDGGSREVEARLTLRRLLARLSKRQREVVALYEIAGLSADEVAGILRISAAGVRSLARDARHRLAQEGAREAREVSP